MCFNNAVEIEALSDACKRCSQCGVPELTDFLNVTLPPNIFTANTEQDPLIPTKISIQISNFVIDINNLKNSTLKDMIIATEVFPLQAFSCVEYICHSAELTIIKWGYWIRKLVGDNIICPVAKDQTISIFLRCIHEICNKLPLIDEIFKTHKEFLKEISSNVFSKANCNIEIKSLIDYIPFANSLFNIFYKCLDMLIYSILSFESIEHGEGTVYVGYPFNGGLKTFLNYVFYHYKEKIKRIRVVDKDKLPIVEEFLKSKQLKDIVIC